MSALNRYLKALSHIASKYSSFLLDSIFADREQPAKNRQKVKTAQFSWYTVPGRDFRCRWSTPLFMWKIIRNWYLHEYHVSSLEPQQFRCVVVQYLDLDSWITHHVVKPAIKTSRFFVFLSHFFDSWIERGIHILESSKKLLGKAPSNIDFVPTPEIVTTLFLKPRDSPNTKNLTRFMIEYGLSVGSKCNSLKTNQAFKDKLGCPRAIHYLTPPPTRYALGRCPRMKRSNVHVRSTLLLSTCNPYL